MNFSTGDIGHLLLAIGLLLCAAHGCGYLFRWFRQPPVIGEILGGLILGPTIFGAIWPEWQHAVFHGNTQTATVLGAVYQLGLLLLMFCSGTEMRTVFARGERRTTISITLTGTCLPFLAGLLWLNWIDTGPLIGAAGNTTAFVIVFGIALAITSIPVISRILTDLKVLKTSFARIVLSAAVAQDIFLYVMLSVALASVGTAHGDVAGLVGLIGLDGQSWLGITYHIAVSIAFFVVALFAGPRLFRRISKFRYNLLQRSSPVANILLFMLVATAVAIFVGVAPMFGAFVAGLAVGRSTTADRGGPRDVIKSFSFAFFIPIYFAIVGLRLNLIAEFDPIFFIKFLLFACVVGALSVYVGARSTRESHAAAVNFGVAMNARGGPGIVLASLALDAAIISEQFYSSLIMLAIVTSMLAGAWLERRIRRGQPLRPPYPDEQDQPRLQE